MSEQSEGKDSVHLTAPVPTRTFPPATPQPAARKSSAAALIAMIYGLAAGTGMKFPALRTARKERKPFPMMVTASREEIAAHNAVPQRRIDRKRARLASHRVDRRVAKALRGTGQAPKFTKERVRRQHQHLRRDQHGAYTLVGRGELPNGVTDGRRIWLAGISAQRGF